MVSDKEKSIKKKNLDLLVRGKDWERGFTIEENRVSEYVELYESIGYEARVEPATTAEINECQECFKAEFNNLRTIFIRQRENKDNIKDLEEII